MLRFAVQVSMAQRCGSPIAQRGLPLQNWFWRYVPLQILAKEAIRGFSSNKLCNDILLCYYPIIIKILHNLLSFSRMCGSEQGQVGLQVSAGSKGATMTKLRRALAFLLAFSLALAPATASAFADAGPPVDEATASSDTALFESTPDDVIAGETKAPDIEDTAESDGPLASEVVSEPDPESGPALDEESAVAQESASPSPEANATSMGAAAAASAAATLAADGSFAVAVSASIAHPTINLQYRPSGTAEWLEGDLASEGGFFTLSIPSDALQDDVEYDYVVTFMSPSLSNVAAIRVYKIVGTIEREADGTWVHANKNGEAASWMSEASDGSDYVATVTSVPTHLAYKTQILTVRADPANAYQYFGLTDALDSTSYEIGLAYSSWLNLYVPTTNNSTSAATKAAVTAAGYPFVTATGAGTNETALADLAFPYELSAPLFHPAKGVYKPGLATEDAMVSEAGGKYTVTHSMSMWPTYTFVLQQSAYAVMIRGLYEGTQIVPATPADEALMRAEDISGGINVVFEVESGSATVSFSAVHPGLSSIPFAFTVDADAGTIAFDNEAEARGNAEELSFASNIVDVKQLPRLATSTGGTQITAGSESIFEYIQATRSYAPGIVTGGEFRVVNEDPTAAYRIIDYRIDPSYEPFKNLLRSDTVAISRYYNEVRSDIPFNGVDYLYDFEAMTGTSLSDALLELYQRDYPGLTSLFDLPTDVIAGEIFYDNMAWTFTPDSVNPTAPNVVSNGSGYVILETDPVIIELANMLLYERSLALTFDNANYPIAPYLNSTQDPAVSADDDYLKFLYPAYRDKSDANVAMMTEIIEGLPVLRPAGTAGDSISFEDFAFGLNGHFINNPYRVSNYEFSFDFNLILSIVGIEGVAFVDANANGIRDEGEAVLPDVAFRLYDSGDVLVGEYTTDQYGRYVIPNVAPATGYWMEVDAPEGYALTSTVVADNPSGNRFEAATGKTAPFDVELDEAYRYNAGFVSPVAPAQYTVTYHPNGGQGTIVDAASPYSAGANTAVLPHTHAEGESTGFARDGHRFIGWNEVPDGSAAAYASGDPLTVDRHIVLYAQWEPEGGGTDPGTDPNPDPDPKPDPGSIPTKPSSPKGGVTPRTGDPSQPGLLALAIVAFGLTAGSAVALTTKRKSEAAEGGNTNSRRFG